MMMQRDLSPWLVIPLMLISLAACGEQAQQAPVAPVKPVPPSNEAKKVVTGANEGTAAVVEAPPAKYIYMTENRRDPFQPFLMLKRPVDAEADLTAQTPLQQYDTVQYKLSALIVGYGQPMVMVISPDGKSHVLRKGTKIGRSGGTVIEINKEGFRVEEKYRDLTDIIRTNIIEIKLPKREGV
jgi:type IV pilus assembly protein PilP